MSMIVILVIIIIVVLFVFTPLLALFPLPRKFHFYFQVKWAPDNLDGYLNFYSVSGDGRVSNWTIVKTALWTNDTLLINFCKTLNNLGEESVSDLLMGKK